MEERQFGDTGLKASADRFGTWEMGTTREWEVDLTSVS